MCLAVPAEVADALRGRGAFITRSITVDCACTKPWYAYVYPDQPYTIHVCKAFWTAPTTGTDSKGGTLVHEMSHFTVVAGTDDWAYGQTAAGALAGSDPARAVGNADSHESSARTNHAAACGRDRRSHRAGPAIGAVTRSREPCRPGSHPWRRPGTPYRICRSRT